MRKTTTKTADKAAMNTMRSMPPMSMAAMPMMPAGTGMMVPVCKMTIKPCDGGMMMMCMCDDAAACMSLQKMCEMHPGAMMSCCMMMNGMPMCMMNMVAGMCTVKPMKGGICITWTSGDPKMAKMIDECCRMMMSMMDCGMTCCMMMNGRPICCCC